MKQETDNYKISLKEKIVNKIINVGNRIMNTYVYHTPSGYIMIDTGYEHSLPAVEKKLKKRRINICDIKYVFLTHAHDDHAGFLNELLYKNQELKVIVSKESISTLKRGQNSFDGGCSTLLALIFAVLWDFLGKQNIDFLPLKINLMTDS